MIARSTMPAVAAIAAAFLVPACGGDDESDSAGPTGANAGVETDRGSDSGAGGDSGGRGGQSSIETSSLSKEQFVNQANGACQRESRDYTEEVTAFLSGPEVKGRSEEEVALKTVKAVVLPIVEAQIQAIRELGAPEGDEEEVEAALNAQEEAVDELRVLKRITRGESLAVHFAEASAMLRDYGLTGCVFSS